MEAANKNKEIDLREQCRNHKRGNTYI